MNRRIKEPLKAALHVLVETIGAMRALDRARDKELYLAIAGSLYHLTSLNCSDQTVHIDFEVPKDQSPRLFVLLSKSGGICLLVFPAQHTYEHYPMADKKAF